jgi:hypothetical protein
MAATPQTLSDLKGIWSGQTVWVVGSGPSLETTPPEFYDDKRVVSINQSAFSWGIKNYITASNYSRHHPDIQMICDKRPDLLMVTPDCDVSGDRTPTHPGVGNNITFRPRWPVWNPTEGWPTDPDSLVIGGNSSAIAIHLAAYMGCAEMRLIGVDMGKIGDKSNFDGYIRTGGVDPSFEGAMQQLRIVANRLRNDYGCEILRFVGSAWEPVE